MPFDYVNVGTPASAGVASPGSSSPSNYIDKVSGVVYNNSGQGWKETLFSSADAQSTTGTTQNGATAIASRLTRFTTVGVSDGAAVLPKATPGVIHIVKNAAASNPMNVFPASGETINALSANTAFEVLAGKSCMFYCVKATEWETLLSA